MGDARVECVSTVYEPTAGPSSAPEPVVIRPDSFASYLLHNVDQPRYEPPTDCHRVTRLPSLSEYTHLLPGWMEGRNDLLEPDGRVIPPCEKVRVMIFSIVPLLFASCVFWFFFSIAVVGSYREWAREGGSTSHAAISRGAYSVLSFFRADDYERARTISFDL